MEQIDSLQIHLWLAFLDEITDPRLLDEYRRLLSEEELQKQQRFRFERDRHRFLVTRAMVRTVLSRYAEVAPREWRFVFNPHGKPAVAPELVAVTGLEFNVSHTDELVVMGIAWRRAIGVDVESTVARAVDIEMADRYFSPTEAAALRALPPDQQQRRFFEYWTLKESYVKARGMGLSIPLDRFAFDLQSTSAIRLLRGRRLNRLSQAWTFCQFEPKPEHLVAMCIGSSGSGPCSLRIRQTVPLLRESARDCRLLRTSGNVHRSIKERPLNERQ